MVYINSLGTTELFTGAYNKRVEQNKSKVAAGGQRAEHKDTMTAKEYLSQAYRLDQRIDSKIAQVASLNDLATKCTATLTGMPRNPNRGGSTMADAVCKIVDLQEEINRDIDRLVDLKREIVAVIKAVENPEYQVMLEKRYLSFQTWEQIAVDMNYSIQHIYRLREKAYAAVQVPEG